MEQRRLTTANATVVMVRRLLLQDAFATCRSHIFPLLGIASCLYLIWYLPPTSWLRFAAWLNFGFVIYVGYGAQNSRLAGQHSERSAAHDAHTAYAGAWLGLLGTGVLFLMRGLDLWLEALRRQPAHGALAEVLQRQPWMQLSWFLVVPLALNATVLCPTVMRRAWSVRRDRAAHGTWRVATTSFVAAGGLALAIVTYVLIVIARA